MHSLVEILTELGYNLRQCSNYYVSNAAYRDGDNPGALAIYPEKNLCVDFVKGQKFSIKKLLALSLKIENEEKVEEWLSTKGVTLEIKPTKPLIKMPKVFSSEYLKDLTPLHDYWVNRGINKAILPQFKGGVCGEDKGRFANRYVFPIFDGKNQIIGLTGRDLTGKKQNKWKHLGNKDEWKWPLFLNHQLIKSLKRVILVESPGDALSLWTCGIHEVICLFGTVLSGALLNLLIRYDINDIIISTNDDINQAGNLAAEKIESKLLNFFDNRQVWTSLPPGANDWNDLLLQENGIKKIQAWHHALLNDRKTC